MSTYTQITYHIVFGTKQRRPVLDAGSRRDLFRCLWGILKQHDCHALRINGVEDHVHLLTDLHPTVCVSTLVQKLKTGSHRWIDENGIFPGFREWQEGYGAFTLSHADRPRVIEYIRNQENHHRKMTFVEELRRLVEESGMVFDDRYLP